MASNVTCHFLRANPPYCDQSYAESVGTAYDGLQAIYIIFTLLCCTFTFYYTYRVIQRKGLLPLDTQKRIFLLVSFMSVTLFIRCIDPNGWRNIVPLSIIQLCYDMGTSAFYSMSFFVIFDWIAVIAKVSGYGSSKDKIMWMFRVMHVIIWLSWTTLALLQANENNIYLWRAIKLFIGAIVSLTVLALLMVFGFAIYRTLRTTEKMREQENHRKSMSGTLDKPKKVNKSKLVHIKHMIRLSSFFILVTILLQLYVAFSSINDKYTFDDPAPPPTTFGDALFELGFDIVHVVVIFTACYFFRPKDPKIEEENRKKEQQEEQGAADRVSTTHSHKQSITSKQSAHSRDQSKLSLQALEEDDSGDLPTQRSSTEILLNVRTSSEPGPTGGEAVVEQPQITLSSAPNLPKRPSPYHHRMEPTRALPPGWEEFVNEQGLHYYHNAALQTTVWDPPTE